MNINSCSGTSSSLSVGESTPTADEQNATASTSKLASALNKVSSSVVSGDTGELKNLKEVGKSVEKEAQRSAGKVGREARRFFKKL